MHNPLTATELADAIAGGAKIHLIDVRTGSEFDAGHIAGSHNVPLADLQTHAERLAELRRPMVLVCRSGARAQSAAAVLRHAGARHLRLLEGGVLAWQRAGHTLVAESSAAGSFLRVAAGMFGLGPRRNSAAAVDALLASSE